MTRLNLYQLFPSRSPVSCLFIFSPNSKDCLRDETDPNMDPVQKIQCCVRCHWHGTEVSHGCYSAVVLLPGKLQRLCGSA